MSDKISETAIEAINVAKDTLENDPTKDLIAFITEDMVKSCKLTQYPPH